MFRQTKISFLEVMVPEQDSKNEESLNQRGRAFQWDWVSQQLCGAVVWFVAKFKAGSGRGTAIFSESVSFAWSHTLGKPSRVGVVKAHKTKDMSARCPKVLQWITVGYRQETSAERQWTERETEGLEITWEWGRETECGRQVTKRSTFKAGKKAWILGSWKQSSWSGSNSHWCKKGRGALRPWWDKVKSGRQCWKWAWEDDRPEVAATTKDREKEHEEYSQEPWNLAGIYPAALVKSHASAVPPLTHL